MSRSPRILVVGAGIGGLTVATALAQGGADVELFESAPQITDIGAGLQLSANALHVYAALNILDSVQDIAFEPRRALTRHYKSGRIELSLPLKDVHRTRYGQPYLHVHRADLVGVLKTAAVAAGVSVHLGHRATHYTQSQNNITLHVNPPSGAPQTFEGDIVIGADGIHSKIRDTMHGDHQARFTGQVAWRGLIPTQAVPEGLISPDANVWLGPDRHFVAYYVRGGKFINFVAVQEHDDWAEESWVQPGQMEDVLSVFAGWDPDIATLLRACEACFLWGLFDRPPLSHWVDGRAVLMGDAAHPMLPFMAQGAAMAIEDAYVLSEHILEGGIQSLPAYEILRKPRTSRIQAISRQNARIFHARSAFERTFRSAQFHVASRIPAAAHAKFDKIYGHNVTQ